MSSSRLQRRRNMFRSGTQNWHICSRYNLFLSNWHSCSNPLVSLNVSSLNWSFWPLSNTAVSRRGLQDADVCESFSWGILDWGVSLLTPVCCKGELLRDRDPPAPNPDAELTMTNNGEVCLPVDWQVPSACGLCGSVCLCWFGDATDHLHPLFGGGVSLWPCWLC